MSSQRIARRSEAPASSEAAGQDDDATDLSWRAMLVVDGCLMGALFLYKIYFSVPDYPYTQLLADYHFGMMKRALIGALLGLVAPQVPAWAPYALGSIVWLATIACFVLVFERAFGVRRQFPLFVFVISSPFFLKNFVQTLGYFDVYGCLLVLVMLLVPARSVVYVISAAAGGIALLLIHQLHMLLYIPTLTCVVALRYSAARPISQSDVLLFGLLLMAFGGCFTILQFAGSPPVPVEVLDSYMKSRMIGPPIAGHIFPNIYYRTLADEIRDTWRFMPVNLLRVPFYVFLVALHYPLIGLLRETVRSIGSETSRRATIVAVVLVTAGYLPIFATVFDYSRWVASWATCMILLILAVRQHAGTDKQIRFPTGRSTRIVAWVLTFLPRLGTVTPF